VIDGLRGCRDGIDNVQVLLLDEQTGPFEAAYWRRIFSPAFPILRVNALKESIAPSTRVRLRRALYVPPGYSNIRLAHVMTEGDCHAGTQLLQSFRRFMLAGTTLPASVIAPAAFDGPIVVTFVSRRPYNEHGVNHAFMGRQVRACERLCCVGMCQSCGCSLRS